MADLKGSKTEDNLKAAFAGESQANRRYLYFAQKADVEGYNDVAAVFRSTAEGETGHAHGHLEFLEVSGDPATGLPIGPTDSNLKAAIAGETHEYTDMYPGMARTAREEGFAEIADWFETLAKAEKSHAGRFQKALDTMALSPSGLVEGDPTRVPFFSYTAYLHPAWQRAERPCAKAASKPRSVTTSDWQNPWFWDEKALEKEMERVFDICHGCRRCFNLCDSFPRLFDLIDNGPTGELDGVKKEDYAQVEEACTLCDMCFMTKCPYVPPHEWALDFPHLMLRHRAVQARKKGVNFVDKQLADTDRSGRIGNFLASAVNWASDEHNHDDAPQHGALDRHPSRRPPAALCRRDLRNPRAPRRRRAERGGAGLRQAQGRALCHLLRELQQHRHRRRRARRAGQERRRDRGRASGLLRHAEARAGRHRIGRQRRARSVGGRCCRGSTRATTSSR